MQTIDPANGASDVVDELWQALQEDEYRIEASFDNFHPGGVDTTATSIIHTLDTTIGTPGIPASGAFSDGWINIAENSGFSVTVDVSDADFNDSDDIELFHGTTSLGSLEVSAAVSGTLTFGISGLADATSGTFTAEASDDAGNTQLSGVTSNITVDVTAPSAPTTPDLTTDSAGATGTATDDLTNDNTPTFDVDGETGFTVEVFANNGTNHSLGTGIPASTVSITSTKTLTDDDYDVTATQTDLAGNTSTVSGTLPIEIDTVVTFSSTPDLTTDSAGATGTATDDLTNDNTPSFSGTAEDTSTIQLRNGTQDNSASVVTGAGAGAVAWAITVANGEFLIDAPVHNMDVTVEDAAGNSVDSADLPIEIDTIITATTVPDLRAADDSGFDATDDETNITTPGFIGTTEDTSTVQLRNGTQNNGASIVTAAGAGAQSYTVVVTDALLEGNNAIDVTVEGAAGNSIDTADLTTLIDVTGPPTRTVTINSNDPSTVDRFVSLANTCDDANGGIAVSGCRSFKLSGDVVTPVDFTTTAPTTAVLVTPRGDKTAQFDFRDEAGNISVADDSIELDAEVSTPSVSITDPQWLVDEVFINGTTKNPDLVNFDNMTIAYGSPTNVDVEFITNADLDCTDNPATLRFVGDPFNGVADDCYDASNNLRGDRLETSDEEIHNGLDDDGDGLIDEDTDSIYAWGTSSFYTCPSDDPSSNPHTPSAALVDQNDDVVQNNAGNDLNVTAAQVTVQKHDDISTTFTITDMINRLADGNSNYQFDYPVDTFVEYTDDEVFGTTNTCSFDTLTVTYTGNLLNQTSYAGTLSGDDPGELGDTSDRLKVDDEDSVGGSKDITVTLDTNLDYVVAPTTISNNVITQHRIDAVLNTQPPLVANTPLAATGSLVDTDLASDAVPGFTDTGDTDGLSLTFNQITSNSLGQNPALTSTTTHSVTITDDNAVKSQIVVVIPDGDDEGTPVVIPDLNVDVIKAKEGAIFSFPGNPVQVSFEVINMMVGNSTKLNVTSSLGFSGEFIEANTNQPDFNIISTKCTSCDPQTEGITEIEILHIGRNQTTGIGPGTVGPLGANDDFLAISSITLSYLDTEPSIIRNFNFTEIFALGSPGDAGDLHADEASFNMGKSTFNGRALSFPGGPFPTSYEYDVSLDSNLSYFEAAADLTNNDQTYSTSSPGSAGSASGVGGTGAQITSDSGIGFVSAGCAADTDNDAICNEWEAAPPSIPYSGGLGVTHDYLLPTSLNQGPLTFKPDIMVEIDYMEDHEPSAAALASIKTSFGNAALEKPTNNGRGINIHLELGDEIPHSSFLNVWTDVDFDRTNDFESIKADWFGKPTERLDVTGTAQAGSVTGGNGSPTARTLKVGSVSASDGITIERDPAFVDTHSSGTMTIITDLILTGAEGTNPEVVVGTPTQNRFVAGSLMRTFIGGVTVTAFDADLDDDRIKRFIVKVPYVLLSDGPHRFPAINIPFTLEGNVPITIADVTTAVQTAPHSPTTITTLQAAKAQVFHYVLVGHGMGSGPNCDGPTGIAELQGNDAIITLGCGIGEAEELEKNIGGVADLSATVGGTAPTVGYPLQFAGTFVHELGHNLGLNHGGPQKFLATGLTNPDSYVNCKANYASVMSYSRQLPLFLGSTDFKPDYSEGLLPDINENTITESNFVYPEPVELATRNTVSGVPLHVGDLNMVVGHIGGTIGQFGGDVSVQAVNTVIDWDGDGDVTSPPPFDVNEIDFVGDPCPTSAGQTLQDFDDFHNINMNLRGVAGANFDAQVFKPVNIGHELTGDNEDDALAEFDWYDGLLRFHTINPDDGIDTDGDGVINEDPPTNKDNDFDGLVDEDDPDSNTVTQGDIANISFQMLSCSPINGAGPDECVDTKKLVKQKDWYVDTSNNEFGNDPNGAEELTVVTGKSLSLLIERVADLPGQTVGAGTEFAGEADAKFHYHPESPDNGYYHFALETDGVIIDGETLPFVPGVYALFIIDDGNNFGPLLDRNIDSSGREIFVALVPDHDFDGLPGNDPTSGLRATLLLTVEEAGP